MRAWIGIAVSGALAGVAGPLSAQTAAGRLGPGLAAGSEAVGPELLVEPVAERVVTALPAGPLYWRIEEAPSLAAAQARAGPYGLAGAAWGRAWLFTLGAAEGPGTVVGPAPIPPAKRYLLRVNRAGGPPGARTPVHTHAGSEAFYVLKGELTQKTPHGTARLAAGKTMNGHAPGMTMQLFSSGTQDLEQLVLFVVDADQPFSSPARF